MKTKYIHLNIKFLLLCLAMVTLHAEPIRIMPLGDSITYDNRKTDLENPRSSSVRTGYRSHLWYALNRGGYEVDFVGSKVAGDAIEPPFDPDNEGHPGWTDNDIATHIYDFLVQNPADIILLHIGTNDNSKSVRGVESILNEIDHFERNSGKTIQVILAMIIDRQSPDPIIAAFNHNLINLFEQRWEDGDILTLVNMYRDAGLTHNDYADNTHPNNSGYQKMATVWYKAITTPYVKYTSAPRTKDDKASGQTGTPVSLNILINDVDKQNDMNASSVSLIGGKDTDGDGDLDKLTVSGEGQWNVTEEGIVTFVPEKNFTSDPTPITYTVKDNEGQTSAPAKISIDYSNLSLQEFPYTLVNESYIESISINEASNSIEFITMIPDEGIIF